jgi:large subunit ribosomal protein L29
VKGRELRELSVEELQLKERELAEQLFNLRFQHATGQLENTMALRHARKDIARVKTLLREKAGGGR